ncbi:HAMP domain-containing histidine kinase [Eubacteriales bacterium OttesenSCG-928-K08]|nr:HAMP domain-containing histidine kinase [Eubacteriales bacterium OttesenSCG-928-K08]
MLWLYLLCTAFAIAVIVLLAKIALLLRSADEIAIGFRDKLEHDTNTLITISSSDRHMRRLAAEINAQLRLLRQERHRFAQGNLELRDAVTNISHDLRTPLTAICGYLDLLKHEEKSEDAVRYIGMIENRAEALKQLTEELFDYSIVTSFPQTSAYEDTALGSALEQSIAIHYAALLERGITPKIDLPIQTILRRLDKMALSRIFSNIISNAVKYSDGDLHIVLRENGEMVFSNSAKDLTPVTVGKLFDRFFTLETGSGSTGLGLSIAKLLTEQMGGTISAEYADGKLDVILRF